MITYYFRTIKDDSIKVIDDVRSGVWIHAQSPSEADLTALFEKLSLDKDLIEDALDFFEVPRLEQSEGSTYFFTRYPYNEQKEDIDTAPLLIVIGETFVLTVAQRPVPQFERFVKGLEVIHTTQKTKLFLQFMQAITESFNKQLVRLRRSVQKDRAQIRKIGNREIERFVNYEDKLNDTITALMPTTAALRQVNKGNFIQLFEDDKDMMEDLVIDNDQLVDSARSVLKTIQNVRYATEAILANNLNATIRTLTLVTVLLTIPMVVASLYGMNVTLPFAEASWAFWAILGLVLAIVGGVIAFFKRNGWL